MSDKYLIEPDVGFIKEVEALGGDTLKKCFQCATCSVACPISPDNKPFPRKEMIAASWGLKDRLIKNADIWLCHNCGDCTTLCPRGAKPGETMAALRQYTITDYARPKKLAKIVNDPKQFPLLIAIPVVYMLALGLILKLFGIDWLNFSPSTSHIAHSNFIHTWLIDLIFVPLSLWAVAIFALSLRSFIKDIHENALLEGKTDQDKIDPKGFIDALIRVILPILKHNKFAECGENEERATSHLMVLWGFIGLFIVTAVFFFHLYALGYHGPYSQLHPFKWLGNIAGIALVIGASLMLKDRLAKKDEQPSTYQDWYLIGLALGLGLTGLLAEMTRLAGAATLSYIVYFIHLIFVFNMFAFVPYTKLAHLVYRTVAMAYAEYAGRKFVETK